MTKRPQSASSVSSMHCWVPARIGNIKKYNPNRTRLTKQIDAARGSSTLSLIFDAMAREGAVGVVAVQLVSLVLAVVFETGCELVIAMAGSLVACVW